MLQKELFRPFRRNRQKKLFRPFRMNFLNFQKEFFRPLGTFQRPFRRNFLDLLEETFQRSFRRNLLDRLEGTFQRPFKIKFLDPLEGNLVFQTFWTISTRKRLCHSLLFIIISHFCIFIIFCYINIVNAILFKFITFCYIS